MDLLLQEEQCQAQEQFAPAAMICSVLANINRGEDDAPWKPSDFMPGASSDRDEMLAFVEAIEAGETFDVDPGEMAVFKQQLESTFSNIAT